MPNPFGMAEFSVPQLLGLNEQMKSRRIEDMYRQKQFERQEKQDKRDDEEYTRSADARAAIGRGAKPEEVIALDPKTGFSYAEHARSLAKEQREESARRAEDVGSAAVYLSELPESEMAAQWDPVIDRLVSMGYTDLAEAKGKPNRAALGPIIAASKEAVQAYAEGRRAAADDARADKQLGISQGNLDLSRQREGRIQKWGPQPLIGVMGGVSSDTSDLDY